MPVNASKQEPSQSKPPHPDRLGPIEAWEAEQDQQRRQGEDDVRGHQPHLGLENCGGGLLARVERGRHGQQQATHDQGQPAPAPQRGQRWAAGFEDSALFHYLHPPFARSLVIVAEVVDA